jgi:hypothetical protein
MPDDNIPTGRPIELTPKNQYAALLIKLRRSEWIKRQGVKLGAIAAAASATWLVSKGGQEYAATIAAGVGAGVIFLWEIIWSWLEFKASNVRTIEALKTEPPTGRANINAEVRRLAGKDTSPPVVPVILLCALTVAMAAPACRSRTPGPAVTILPTEPPQVLAATPTQPEPSWFDSLRQSIADALTKRHAQQITE